MNQSINQENDSRIIKIMVAAVTKFIFNIN